MSCLLDRPALETRNRFKKSRMREEYAILGEVLYEDYGTSFDGGYDQEPQPVVSTIEEAIFAKVFALEKRSREDSILIIANNLADSGKPDSALDVIYQGFDRYLKLGHISKIEQILGAADPSWIDLDVCIALLSCTLPVKDSVENRSSLYQKVAHALRKNGENVDRALVGLI